MIGAIQKIKQKSTGENKATESAVLYLNFFDSNIEEALTVSLNGTILELIPDDKDAFATIKGLSPKNCTYAYKVTGNTTRIYQTLNVTSKLKTTLERIEIKAYGENAL